MDRLTSMSVFVAAVDAGSFAGAASRLDLSATMIGLHVRSLEDRLGARLLNRTTRRQNLTEIGRLYYERCRQIMADVEAADTIAKELQAEPRGRLRVSAAVSFGVHALMPAMSEFLAQYPSVGLELSLNDRVVDLLEEGFDAAIRIGTLPDSSLVARPLAPYRSVLCAAPSYLERHGAPSEPKELADHNCLVFSFAGDSWRLQDARGEHHVRVKGQVLTNNGEALRRAALAGLGIVLQPEVLLAADLAAGRLVQLLPDVSMPSREAHLVYLPDRRPTPKLRALIDFVIGRFGQAGAWAH